MLLAFPSNKKLHTTKISCRLYKMHSIHATSVMLRTWLQLDTFYL